MKKNNKGFTLAELLIVVAIIAVLVAIAIPVFSAQLEKSKEATDIANIRSAYATLVAKYLEDTSANTITVPCAGQKDTDWHISNNTLQTMVDGTVSQISVTAITSGNYTVAITDSGSITVS